MEPQVLRRLFDVVRDQSFILVRKKAVPFLYLKMNYSYFLPNVQFLNGLESDKLPSGLKRASMLMKGKDKEEGTLDSLPFQKRGKILQLSIGNLKHTFLSEI